MKLNTENIINENEERLKKINTPYDPLVGIGSLISREKIVIDDLGEFYLPKSFFETPIGEAFYNTGNLSQFAKIAGLKSNADAALAFINERIRHDFEYWAAYAISIQDGISLKEIPFILRIPQRILLSVLMKMFWAGEPILSIIVKARQWGGSTLVQFFMMWIQQVHEKNWHMAICAQDDGAAGNVREMVMRAVENYPKELNTITFKPYARSPKNIVNVERGGIIGIGSINNPKQFRSYNYTMLHSTEVCEWDETEKRGAKQLVTALRSVLKGQPRSVDVVESTAKGMGNFFHKEWQDAVNGKSKYKPVFIGHNQIEIYQRELEMPIQNFINSFNEHDEFLWESGSTLENINWYKNTMTEKNYDEWQMKQEYPTTASEAFQSSGQRVFAQKYVINIRKTCKEPIAVGHLYSASNQGEKSIKDLLFEKSKDGNLSVWEMPETIIHINGKMYKMKDRYCGFGDIGGRTKNADFSELTTIDRYWMCPEINGGLPGLPVVASQWHGHLDQDLFAWKCAAIGTWYNNMLLAIESNSLKKIETDGNHFLTILDEIAPFYPNLFIRNNIDSINSDFVPKYGFHTGNGGEQGKSVLIDNLNALMREKEYIERDTRACDQFDYYEIKPNGSLGAVKGEHDDMTITRAGALWLATKYMKLPKLIEIIPDSQKRRGRATRMLSEASI